MERPTHPPKLGRYVIERVLGKGAMGVVYLARDPVIGRQVALKTLSVPSDAEEAEEFRQRFLREAQAAGILTHPGIVTVHDAGVDEESGLSFIAMEFIEGRSLKDVMRSGRPFTYSEVAAVGGALAGALAYAHSKGVVHRDIKPANIIITTQGLVKITDFGVARLESSNLTTTGQFIGTPNYMSPEQVTGAPVDGRSDLFSLGVVLFELLTGVRPFAGGSLSEVAYRIVHERPAIPSQLRSGLPAAFNPIVLKLLEKDPERRYQRGEDVARALEALRRVLTGAGAEAPRPSEPPPTQPAELEASQSLSSAQTVTRATSLERPTLPRPALPPVFRLPINPRWVAVLLALLVLPLAATLAALSTRIDRGPFPGVPAGEAERRHRVADAQRAAAEALQRGDPVGALRQLELVWDQAPHSDVARMLAAQARELEATQRELLSRREQAQRLREEGRESLRQGRWRQAQARFEAALELDDDPLSREYLELARDRVRAAEQRGSWTRPVPTPVDP
ncbi:MAG: serine/threonine protein kinase, partial [Acidobacteriota bacterium]